MGHPTVIGAMRPLEEVDIEVSGPAALTAPSLGTLRALGARLDARPSGGSPAAPSGPARFAATGRRLGEVTAYTAWADVLPDADAADEATVQAATGMMHVHGRRDGAPRGLAVDYAATCASVLSVQGLLAGLLGRARGVSGAVELGTGADRAALLTLSQYLAAANAPEAEAVPSAPGGPPFTSSCARLSNWRRWSPAPGRGSGAHSVHPRTRYAPAGAPSSSGTPPPARRCPSRCTRRHAPFPGRGSGRPPRPRGPRSVPCIR
ncbi:hypothetical protein [Streptomyces sioyaensis]|uniref:hypothetical protein n=1 Tax=Streptomyces sioyaensis TaxID=67364 RepID=UPI00371D77BC